MEKAPDKNVEPAQEVQDPGRRRLLKILAAGGVVTAASMIPDKWVSPILKSGVLPAHAQVTPAPGRYDIICDPEWSVEIDDTNYPSLYHYQFAATALDNGSPLANVELRGIVYNGPQTESSIESTNAQGVANFRITTGISTKGPPSAEVAFNDPLFGDASCGILLEIEG